MPNKLLRAFLEREAAHDEQLSAQARRGEGVCWSGLAPPPSAPRTPAQRRAAAEARWRDVRDWTQSPPGRLDRALAAVQSAARDLDRLASEARLAAGRSPQEMAAGLPGRLSHLDAHARRLRRSLTQARRILSGRPPSQVG